LSIGKPFMLAAGLAGALLLAFPAMAQEAAPEPVLSAADSKLLLDVPGQRLAMPLPDWINAGEVSSGDVRPLVELSYSVENGQVRLDVRPKGQSQTDWKTAFGAHLQEQTSGTLVGFRRSVMAGYGQTCQPNTMAFFQFGQDSGDELAPLGFACGAFFDGIEGFAGQGEVAVMSFRKSAKGVAVFYQAWRGPAFDPAKASSWPVPTKVVEERSRQLQAEVSLTLAD
jgi:hypothetical protein